MLHRLFHLAISMITATLLCFPMTVIGSTEDTTGIPADESTVIILNASGATLNSGNQDITDNGKLITSLPRMSYTRIHIPSGEHEFRFKAFPQGNRFAKLNAGAGSTYYLLVGYSPGRSWSFPFGGDPMTIKIINEAEALTLIKDMKEQ